MTFDQLIEYNLRNIFLKKSYTKFCEESSPRPFSGKVLKSEVLYSLFLLYAKLSAIKVY